MQPNHFYGCADTGHKNKCQSSSDRRNRGSAFATNGEFTDPPVSVLDKLALCWGSLNCQILIWQQGDWHFDWVTNRSSCCYATGITISSWKMKQATTITMQINNEKFSFQNRKRLLLSATGTHSQSASADSAVFFHYCLRHRASRQPPPSSRSSCHLRGKCHAKPFDSNVWQSAVS